MSDAPEAHPSPGRLAAFRQGKLGPTVGAEIDQHLRECPECEAKLRRLPDDFPVETVFEVKVDPEVLARFGGSTEAATVAVSAPSSASGPGLPAELAHHPRYRVRDLLGTGGMGAVYKAEHLLMGRTVALKVINKALTQDADAIGRFQREVKAAARLSHPNIVAAYDAEQAGNSHFLVMEYVEGTSLDRVQKERKRLPIGQACSYIRQAAVGLQHAHDCGMVHRDIKPANLMVTPRGQVKVLDFGLARFARGDGPSAALTQTNQSMGTPDYIAPEQALNARQADIRADIYSLGCTLYHLLAGRVPFPNGGTFDKLLAHLESTPPPITGFRTEVPTGLAQVLERMMAKDPAQRYQTPAEVAQALAPFADAGPDAAQTMPALSQPAQTALPATAALREPLPARSAVAVTDPAAAPPRRGWGLAVVIGLVFIGIVACLAAAAYLFLKQRQAAAGGGAGGEGHNPDAAPAAGEVRRLEGHTGFVRCAVFLPGDRQVLSGSRDRTLRLWDAATGQELGQLEGQRTPVTCLAVSPDGRRALSGGAGAGALNRDGRRPAVGGTHLWDLAAKKHVLAILGDREPVWGVAFSADGRSALVAGGDREVRQYSLDTGKLLRSLVGHTAAVSSVVLAAGGHAVLTGSADKTIRLWNLDTGQETRRYEGHTDAVRCLALSPTGHRFLSGGADATVRLWDLARDKPVRTCTGHTRTVTTVAFLPDGRHAVSGSLDQTVRLWDLDSGQAVYEITGLGYPIESVAVAVDGRQILIAGQNSILRLWRLPDLAAVSQLGEPGASASEESVVPLPPGVNTPDLPRLTWRGSAGVPAGKTPLAPPLRRAG